MTLPTFAAREAINRGLGQVTRRVQIFESDGITPWDAAGSQSRLVDGSVSITYGDNERRALDLTLDNSDNKLRSSPNGFWYDKVIKAYRGVKFTGSTIAPRALVLESTAGMTEGVRFAAFLKRFGIDAVYYSSVPLAGELLNYDMIFSFTGTTATAYASTLLSLYNQGKSITTISVANTSAHVPHITATTSQSSTWGISQPTQGTELSPGWTTEAITGTVTGAAPTALAAGGVPVSRWLMGNGSYGITGSVAFNQAGGRWFDLHLQSLTGASGSAQINTLFANGMKWLRSGALATSWETQVGEFVIDGINGDYFPSSVKITARDYVKKCMNSKVESALTFDAGTNINTIVKALGANSGITKMRLAAMPEVLTSDLSFDRGTPRWDIMRAAATAFNYEIFFDAEGFLQTRQFVDPSTTNPTFTFQTGLEGNLSTLSRATNDSRIYNHIVVYGDPASGEQRMPYVGEAKNINPTSPTRISKIGDRYYSYASTFYTSQQQCKDTADRFLKIHALESYELSFAAINYPWLEVGEVAKVIDPKATVYDPSTYLIDSGTIPLNLGPMSVTGKRITQVG